MHRITICWQSLRRKLWQVTPHYAPNKNSDSVAVARKSMQMQLMHMNRINTGNPYVTTRLAAKHLKLEHLLDGEARVGRKTLLMSVEIMEIVG